MNMNSLPPLQLTSPHRLVAVQVLTAPSSCLSVPGPQQPLFAKILLHPSTWINFLKDNVIPLLKESENNITVYHSPIGFKNAMARDNYINYLKNIMEEVPEKERQWLKELIDEDFGLLELATNA